MPETKTAVYSSRKHPELHFGLTGEIIDAKVLLPKYKIKILKEQFLFRPHGENTLYSVPKGNLFFGYPDYKDEHYHE